LDRLVRMSDGLRRLFTGGSRQLIHRILDQPNLVAAVQSLPPDVLGRVIGHIGLEDAGEIAALATTPQLVAIFDDDLWHSPGPGEPESFDADRFALWLEVMLEAGEAFAAQKLAELPEDLVTLAFHKQVLVINIEALAIGMSSSKTAEYPADDDVQLEKALESCLCEELGEYRIISRRHESWDTLFGLLVALDRDHHDFLQRLLERLCAMDAEFIDDNGGLFEVLTATESLEDDVAGDRDDRRAEQGFIAPSDAAAFLSLARTSKLDVLVASDERDPITRAYFRRLRRQPERNATAAPVTADKGSTPEASDLLALLREAEVLPQAPSTHLLEGKSAKTSEAAVDAFTAALRLIADRAPGIHATRVQELAYLANVLVAGCNLGRRSMRPVEAARAALATSSLGLEHLLTQQPKPGSAARMVECTAADKLFLIGWHILFYEVVLPAAGSAMAILEKAANANEINQGEIQRVASALRSAIAKGKPWTALPHLDVLEERVGHPTFATLAALFGECPTLAVRLASDDESESGFIATNEQIRTARTFIIRLV